MKDWRGVIVQLATLCAVVALVGMSKGAEPGLVHFALGVVGGSYGVALARARSEAAAVGGALGAIPGRSLPPIIGGVVGFVVAFVLGRVIIG